MPFRFFKRIKVAKGVTLNLSKTGASVSLGKGPVKTTVGRKRITKTVTIPGTGIRWTERKKLK